jgi:hypothetical protein
VYKDVLATNTITQKMGRERPEENIKLNSVEAVVQFFFVR